jgi:hypothetical protein
MTAMAKTALIPVARDAVAGGPRAACHPRPVLACRNPNDPHFLKLTATRLFLEG